MSNVDVGFGSASSYSKPLNELVMEIDNDYTSAVTGGVVLALNERLLGVVKTGLFLGATAKNNNQYLEVEFPYEELKTPNIQEFIGLACKLSQLVENDDNTIDFTGAAYVMKHSYHNSLLTSSEARYQPKFIVRYDGVWAVIGLDTTISGKPVKLTIQVYKQGQTPSMYLQTEYASAHTVARQGLHGDPVIVKRWVDMGVLSGNIVKDFINQHLVTVPLPPGGRKRLLPPTRNGRLRVKRKKSRSKPPATARNGWGWWSVSSPIQSTTLSDDASKGERKVHQPTTTHIVQTGESLVYIARKHNIRLVDLMEYNNKQRLRAKVGEELILSDPTNQGIQPRPKPDVHHQQFKRELEKLIKRHPELIQRQKHDTTTKRKPPRHDKFSSMTDYEVEQYLRENNDFHKRKLEYFKKRREERQRGGGRIK